MRALAVLIAFLAGTPTWADDQCFNSSSTAFTAKAWAAEKMNDATVSLSFTILSHLEKPVRMIDVETGFIDALGASMGAFQFGRDHHIEPGEAFEFRGEIGSLLVPRLLQVDAADVVPYVCTRGVVYEDGSKETFE